MGKKEEVYNELRAIIMQAEGSMAAAVKMLGKEPMTPESIPPKLENPTIEDIYEAVGGLSFSLENRIVEIQMHLRLMNKNPELPFQELKKRDLLLESFEE